LSSDLGKLIEMQRQLQIKHQRGGDPSLLDPDERADFMRWNAFALEDEIHEAMQEVGWKPWATSRHVNQPEFMGEMVDAFHFFMNMLICVFPGWSSEEIADEFIAMYEEKNQINAERQESGYDGVSSKCQTCGRELPASGWCFICYRDRMEGKDNA
jgi:dimeric dUTPase (all-alpha-NTP-PPase superfamily)